MFLKLCSFTSLCNVVIVHARFIETIRAFHSRAIWSEKEYSENLVECKSIFSFKVSDDSNSLEFVLCKKVNRDLRYCGKIIKE